MWTYFRSLTLTRIVTVIFMLLLIIGLIFLPAIVRDYLRISGKPDSLYTGLLIVLYASAVPAAALLGCLWRLLENMAHKKVFTRENTKLLRVLSWCCFLISLIYAVFCYQYVMAVIISVAAAFIGLILRVIKNVFEQAYEIKTENDFTV